MTKYDLNLRDYWRVIKKRKFIVIFTFLAMALFSFISAIVTSPTPLYKTSASVKIEKTVVASGLYDQSFFTAGNIETEATIIKSYFLQEMVAKKMGLIPKDAPPEEVRNNSQYINTIMDLKNKIETEQDGVSSLINIIVTSTDPKFAQNLANTVAQVYKDQHMLNLNRKAIESRKFIEDQLAIVKAKLSNSEELVKDFREKNKLITVEGESSRLAAQLASLQSTYDKDVGLYQQVIQMVRLMRGAEDRPLASDKVFSFSGATTSYNSLNDRLVQLMLQKDMLLVSYTENFPQVKEIKKQIQEVLRAMKSQLSAQERALLSEMGFLKKQIKVLDEEIRGIPEKGLDLTRLERNASVEREVYTLLEKKYQEALIQEAVKIEEVQIVKPALVPKIPINPPKTGVNTILGMIIGLILGIVFAFLIETFDTSIAAIEEIEAFLETRVLGIIPYFKIDEIRDALKDGLSVGIDEDTIRRHFRLIAHFMPTSTLTENYRALRTNFNFLTIEKDIKTVVFTSTYPGEGKTSVTTNLAITMAQSGRKVLLVDGDFRRPVISKTFGIEPVPGLTDVILGNYEWRSVVRSITDLMMGKMTVEDVTKTPGLDNLYILTSGTIAPNPSELIGSKSVAELIKAFRLEYDVVLIDAPPVLAATDATIWSSLVDGVIMVYQVGRAARGSLKRAKTQLDNVNAQILGIVLNGLKAEISPDFTYHDKYYYYGHYGRQKRSKKTALWEKFSSLLKGNVLLNVKEEISEKWKTLRGERNREPERLKAGENNIQKTSTLKKIILIISLIFLILGILFQLGYIKASMFAINPFSGEQILKKEKIIPQKKALQENNTALPDKIKIETSAIKFPGSSLGQSAIQQNLSPKQPAAALDMNKAPKETKNKPYSIQITVLSDRKDVDKLISDLKEKGMEAYWEKISIQGKGPLHRIFIGHFEDKEMAMVYMKKKGIQESYPDSIIKKASSDINNQ